MGVLAVRTGSTETDLGTDLEVGTSLVDLAIVYDGELVASYVADIVKNAVQG